MKKASQPMCKLATRAKSAKVAPLSLTSNFARIVVLVSFATVFRFSAGATVFIVTNNGDSGAGCLRQAILDANATPGKDSITFNIAGSAPFTISPGSALPPITDPVVIDGTTQPGYAGAPIVGLVGTGASTANGLAFQTSDSEVRALFINRFSGSGIQIQNGSDNVIAGCFIGTSPAGTSKLANTVAGVVIISSQNNRIGGTNANDRNILSGNQTGLWIAGLTATGNVVQGNFIGTDISGTVALGNANNGVLLSGPGNIIGGASPAARNLISGNGQSGVYINDAFASNNWVCGNYIGTKSNGTVALGNAKDGVTIFRAAQNLIGGSIPGAGNLISGNTERGIYIFTSASNADYNHVEGNLIGLDAIGHTGLGNGFAGVNISAGNNNVIGGTNEAARNVISGNGLSGVAIESNSVANIVSGNFIGLEIRGFGALPNALQGVSVLQGTNNVIGGTAAGAGNVISGNTQNGVHLAGGSGNAVQGNLIGTDFSGHFARANGFNGVRVECASNLIGGDALVGRNVISGNASTGVLLMGVGASNNVIAGNFIGTDITGSARLGNNISGVGLTNAPRNFIGTTQSLGGNVISANASTGIYLSGAGATGNHFSGNFIGTDVSGTLALGNNHGGLFIYGSPTNFIGGTEAGARNLISGNVFVAVSIGDPGANGNVLLGNYIGTQVDGNSPLPNQLHGIEFIDTAGGLSGNIVGGTAPGAGNRIAFAQTIYSGVRLRDSVTRTAIRGNAIFSNGALGIDLGTFGTASNDLGDIDTGANNLQNFPVLVAATGRYLTTITGSLNSRASAVFTIDFYGNAVADPSGFGEGQRYIGSATVQTAADGNVNFTVTLTNTVSVGDFISATATDSAGNTSEFSAIATVPPSLDSDGDGLPDDYELAFGLNPNSSADRDLDLDGDGATNFQEFLAGTKPNDAASAFRITMERQTDRTLIFLNTVSGATYRVESAPEVTGPWGIVIDGWTGNGTPLRVTEATVAATRFYRVRAN